MLNPFVDRINRIAKRESLIRVVLLMMLFSLISCTTVANLSTQQSRASQKSQSKAELTPAFWQRDPDADFEDEGRQHCAPTAASDGLIYLAIANNLPDLVPGTEKKKDHISLIEELAEDFQTDPSIGGTNPDKILTGLQRYVERQGYRLNRLELATWRPVSNANKKYKIASKPDINWLRSAVLDKDTVVILNFGWYGSNDDGYTRNGGHWVIAVGVKDNSNEFLINNPILKVADQATKKSLVLEELTDDFEVVDTGISSVKELNLTGYYDGSGAGLARRDSVEAAVLDAVIVFSIKK